MDSLDWRTSTRSNNGGDCVEVATNTAATDGVVHVRDSKNRDAGSLAVAAADWMAFVAGVKAGDFD